MKKKRGAYTAERMGKLRAGGVRARRRKRLEGAAVAAGREIAGHGYGEPTGFLIDISPAAFRSATTHVGDCEYIDDGLDGCLLRALHERVVYAGSPYSHHEPALQELTIEVIAATERHHMKMAKNGPDPRKRSLPLPSKGHLSKRPISARQLELIGLLAMGLSKAVIARRLGIQERTVKMHCDVLRTKLGVRHVREIPFAYREKTGRDPFSLVPEATPLDTRGGTPLVSVVTEMFPESKVGKPLLEVVSKMFDS